MESLSGSSFICADSLMKKRRSNTRRPRSNVWLAFDDSNLALPSPSNSRRPSPDESGCGETSFRRKEFYLNSPSPSGLATPAAHSKKATRDDKAFQKSSGYSGGVLSRDCRLSEHANEGALGSAKWKRTSKIYEGFEIKSGALDGNRKSGEDFGTHHLEAAHGTSENKLRKVKLKVGGVTRTIHAKPDMISVDVRSAKPPRSLDTSCQQLSSQVGDFPKEEGGNLHEDTLKHSSQLNFPHGRKEDFRNKVLQTSLSAKQPEPSFEPTRKSTRIPKRRVFDDAEGDGEPPYAEKAKKYKVAADHVSEFHGENGVSKSNISKHSKTRNATYEVDEEYVLSRSSKDNRKKSRQGRECEDMDYFEEEETGSDAGPDAGPDSKRKKQKASIESPSDVRTEPLTTRQRALQSGKTGNGESLIEFPNGLPTAPARKQKKLSEVEMQAKKAEAAQRRKMQVEKKARESEALAIRKILGHDSDKKKEEKQKELEERAKAAKSQALQPSTVRWVMGPTGTVVIFADDVDLPDIFSSKPSSYPPPREKCAGPSCTNVYKYRDSKSNLPLCSLQCYRAVQGRTSSCFSIEVMHSMNGEIFDAHD